MAGTFEINPKIISTKIYLCIPICMCVKLQSTTKYKLSRGFLKNCIFKLSILLRNFQILSVFHSSFVSN
jgi:hypothetical protein